jgi:hypothetical protein
MMYASLLPKLLYHVIYGSVIKGSNYDELKFLAEEFWAKINQILRGKSRHEALSDLHVR